MANGNGNVWHEGVPNWAKTLAFLVGTLGVPVMVTGYFMAQNAGVIGSPQLRNEVAVKDLDRDLENHHKAFESVAILMRDAGTRRDVWQDKMLHVLVQTCKVQARNAEQTRDCEYWRK
jgi:uncharacterized protein involved in cysteine biosynthesis